MDVATPLPSREPARPGRIAPGPRGHFITGPLAEIREDVLGFLTASAERYGDVFRMRFAALVAHVARHPDHVAYVLKDNAKNYDKQTAGYKALSRALGRGLLTSEGDFWLRQRRIAQPAFHKKRIAGFATVMVRATEEMLARWTPKLESGEIIDVAAEMMRLTLQIVAETLLGIRIAAEADEVGEALEVMLPYIRETSEAILPLPLAVPTARNRRFKRAVAAVDRIVMRCIEARRGAPGDGNDLLSMLMSSQDEETGERMTDRQLRDEVVTMILAGHETTANALTWTFYLLSQNPDARARVEAEVDTVLGASSASLEALRDLKYTRRVIDESLRLYPPAWIVERSAIMADRLGDFEVPRRSVVLLSPFLTHRHPTFWPDPLRFDPDRFTDEAIAARPSFAYFPFGGGPRQCIGNNFALMEAQLILATVARSVRLSLAPGTKVELNPLVTLRPKDGMPMTMTRRSSP